MNDQEVRDHDEAQQLVVMANDIGNYFRSYGEQEAVASIANHIQRFWTPRMRAKLIAYLVQGSAQLHDLARAAVLRLK